MPLHPRASDHHDNVEHGSVNNHCFALNQQTRKPSCSGVNWPLMNLDEEDVVLSNTISKPVIVCCFASIFALLTSFYSLARCH